MKVGILLETAQFAEEYSFFAFALALLMVLSYWTINNKSVLRVIEKALNKRLTQTALYRFLRLGIILVFTFSVTLVAPSFLSPWLMRREENRAVAMVVEGNIKFRANEYSAAREDCATALSLIPTSQTPTRFAAW